MDKFVVTFARGFGTGGKAIASQLAKDLGIHCYENRILTLASQLSGLDENVFQEVNEKMRETGGFTSFLRGLPRSKSYITRNEKFVSDDKLFEYQSQIIRDLAEKESCVIVGRCADYVLKENPNVVSVFIHADKKFCLERAVERNSMTEKEMQKYSEKTDRFRGDFYRYHTGNEWADARNYDLCLNSGKLGFQKCVEEIKSYIKIRFNEKN